MADEEHSSSSSRVIEAVQAASAHTSDAHFVLLANGYQLDVAIKHAVVSRYIVNLKIVHRTQLQIHSTSVTSVGVIAPFAQANLKWIPEKKHVQRL